jgi:hypothetical protein
MLLIYNNIIAYDFIYLFQFIIKLFSKHTIYKMTNWKTLLIIFLITLTFGCCLGSVSTLQMIEGLDNNTPSTKPAPKPGTFLHSNAGSGHLAHAGHGGHLSLSFPLECGRLHVLTIVVGHAGHTGGIT